MNVVYDTGVLVAVERSERRVWADHDARVERGQVPVVTAPVVAQASRSVRQARLRRLLLTCEIVPFAEEDAHEVGALLARVGTSDVVDAHVAVVAARRKARIVTADVGDLRHLVGHLDHRVAVVPV